MKDKGINKGLVQDFETSNRRTKFGFYGFRQMFRDYLTKLSVPFTDPCCAITDENDKTYFPVRWNDTDSVLERFDGTNWIEIV